MLYASAWKAAKALGWPRLITYTLPEEGGASLKATGWKCVGEAGGTPWNNKVRQRADDHPQGVKWRWEATTETEAQRFRVTKLLQDTSLFE